MGSAHGVHHAANMAFVVRVSDVPPHETRFDAAPSARCVTTSSFPRRSRAGKPATWAAH
jgi:hypothetical protein